MDEVRFALQVRYAARFGVHQQRVRDALYAFDATHGGDQARDISGEYVAVEGDMAFFDCDFDRVRE
jgi:hypothetical protein